ncbi:MAG: PadR family transcriptional regulator [Promethearchaeota archaeon]
MVQSEILQKWETEFKKGFAKPFILLTLAKKPNYAYSLTKEINVNTNSQISITVSSIYPILKNLQDEELIEGKKEPKPTKQPSQDRKPQLRTVYSLTSKGAQLLSSLNNSLEEFSKIILKHIET